MTQEMAARGCALIPAYNRNFPDVKAARHAQVNDALARTGSEWINDALPMTRCRVRRFTRKHFLQGATPAADCQDP